MTDLEVLENRGTAAVKQLRKQELATGNPFMINSKDLPARQAYMEYPDHTISIVTVGPDERSFVTVCKLSASEADAVRVKFDLI